MIDMVNISKSYHGKVRAVDNLNLQIEPGQIFGFLGPNGAGKTTTIKMMTGILTPDNGDILLHGKSIINDPLKAKRSFGFVPDDPNVFPRLKAVEYLKFMADAYNVSTELRIKRINEMSVRLGLSDALSDRIQSYSHGMRQKLMIMGALIHQPDIWILDEPMTGLDPQSSFQLKAMMREHADQGKTVFFSTHVLEVAEKVCDKVAIIDHGQIRFCGSLSELKDKFKSDDSLESIFLEIVAAKEQMS